MSKFVRLWKIKAVSLSEAISCEVDRMRAVSEFKIKQNLHPEFSVSF